MAMDDRGDMTERAAADADAGSQDDPLTDMDAEDAEFLAPILATAMDSWFAALPDDIAAAMGENDDSLPTSSDLIELIKAFSAVDPYSDAARSICREMGYPGIIRMLARMAAFSGVDAGMQIEALAMAVPDRDGVGGAIDTLQEALARRAVGALTDDPAFTAALGAALPHLRPGLDASLSSGRRPGPETGDRQ